MSHLNGKLTVITGASRGIGAASALAFAAEGARVVLIARTESDLREVADKIEAKGGEAHCFPADLSTTEGVVKVAQEIKNQLGDPDILVNNAGLGRWLYTEETPHAEADLMFSLPFRCAFHITAEFLPGMLKRKSGHIINVNSPVSVMPWPGATAYAASRWALRGFSESLRMDLKGTGVRSSHVILGKTSSNYFDANPGTEERVPTISRFIPSFTPEQAAKYVLRAAKTGKKEMTVPFMLWFFRAFQWLMPGVVRSIVISSGYKRK